MGDFPITGRFVDLGLTEATHPPSPFGATYVLRCVSERDYRRGQSPVRAFTWRQYSTWQVFSQVVFSNCLTPLIHQLAVGPLFHAPQRPGGRTPGRCGAWKRGPTASWCMRGVRQFEKTTCEKTCHVEYCRQVKALTGD